MKRGREMESKERERREEMRREEREKGCAGADKEGRKKKEEMKGVDEEKQNMGGEIVGVWKAGSNRVGRRRREGRRERKMEGMTVCTDRHYSFSVRKNKTSFVYQSL